MSALRLRGVIDMRWIFLLLAIIGFSLAFAAKTAGLMGLGFLVGLVGLFGSFFGFAAARIASIARPDTVLLTDKDASALRVGIRKAAAAGEPAQPAAASSPDPG
jgi:hypothetical protein